MLTLSEMKSQVSDRIQKGSTTYLAKIVKWINYRYDDILGRHDWPQLYRVATVTASADTETVTMPRDVGLIINMFDRTNNISLTSVNASIGGRIYGDSQDVSGQTNVYWLEGVTMNAQPTSASTISVVSASASDTSQVVRIWGIDSNGAETSESISLNGTNAVASTASYTRIDRVSKDDNTAGLITGTSNSGAVTVFKIDPYTYGSSYLNLHLVKRPDSDTDYTVTYKIRSPRLINNEDVPIIPCDHALVIGAYVDALRQQRQHQKAKVLEYNPTEPYDPTTYEGKVRSLIQQVEQQGDNVPVMFPTVDQVSVDSIYTGTGIIDGTSAS